MSSRRKASNSNACHRSQASPSAPVTLTPERLRPRIVRAHTLASMDSLLRKSVNERGEPMELALLLMTCQTLIQLLLEPTLGAYMAAGDTTGVMARRLCAAHAKE